MIFIDPKHRKFFLKGNSHSSNVFHLFLWYGANISDFVVYAFWSVKANNWSLEKKRGAHYFCITNVYQLFEELSDFLWFLSFSFMMKQGTRGVFFLFALSPLKERTLFGWMIKSHWKSLKFFEVMSTCFTTIFCLS